MLDNAIHDTPLNKVELTNSGCKPFELDSLCSAKRVKEFLRVSVETALVLYVNWKSVNANLFRL
jgi:hypothetical protein